MTEKPKVFDQVSFDVLEVEKEKALQKVLLVGLLVGY